MSEKLQKVLARAGYGSRREVEGWIAAGRVSVNGQIVTLGARVGENDQIRIDGNPIPKTRLVQVKRRIIIYHKPVGEVCSREDAEARPLVFDALPSAGRGRWVMVGRLDVNTSGLLLFTTDGELANKLMHPSSTIEREYAVRVFGQLAVEQIETLLKGVELEDGPAKFEQILDAGGEGMNHWYHVVLNEGRNREVRRLWESLGVQVSRLTRVRFGHLALPRHLRPGRWEELTEEESTLLLEMVGMAPAPGEAQGDAPRHPHSREGRRHVKGQRRGAGEGQADESGRRPGRGQGQAPRGREATEEAPTRRGRAGPPRPGEARGSGRARHSSASQTRRGEGRERSEHGGEGRGRSGEGRGDSQARQPPRRRTRR